MGATQQEVDRVVGAYENARGAIRYAETIKLEMQQISGTDYKFIWTETEE